MTERYSPGLQYIGTGESVEIMAFDPMGEYVSFDAYSELQTQLTQAMSEIGRFREALRVGTYQATPNDHPKAFAKWDVLLDEGLNKSFDQWFMEQVLNGTEPQED